MTDIDKLAREFMAAYDELSPYADDDVYLQVVVAYLEAGMKLQRERDAVIADNRAKASKTAIEVMPDEDKSYLRGSLIASEQVAAAIRSAL